MNFTKMNLCKVKNPSTSKKDFFFLSRIKKCKAKLTKKEVFL